MKAKVVERHSKQVDQLTDRYHTFATPIGRCGIVWRQRGIARLLLPELQDDALEAMIQLCHPNASRSQPPRTVESAIEFVRQLLNSGKAESTGLRLDFAEITLFRQQVYTLTRRILPGNTSTYGQLARALGKPGAARAVGGALGHNPLPLLIPCHRVLAAGGELGGFTATGGLKLKRRLLEIEGRYSK